MQFENNSALTQGNSSPSVKLVDFVKNDELSNTQYRVEQTLAKSKVNDHRGQQWEENGLGLAWKVLWILREKNLDILYKLWAQILLNISVIICQFHDHAIGKPFIGKKEQTNKQNKQTNTQTNKQHFWSQSPWLLHQNYSTMLLSLAQEVVHPSLWIIDTESSKVVLISLNALKQKYFLFQLVINPVSKIIDS